MKIFYYGTFFAWTVSGKRYVRLADEISGELPAALTEEIYRPRGFV